MVKNNNYNVIFALSKVSALCGHISLVFVWTQPNIFVQISACNCQNCKLFSVEQQSPQTISIMQFTHLPICLSTHSLTIWAEQSSSTRWFSLHQNLHSATMHCNARGGKNLEESNCHKAAMHCKASCRKLLLICLSTHKLYQVLRIYCVFSIKYQEYIVFY